MARKGQGVLLVYTDLIEPKYEEEFDAWYNTKHLPELLANRAVSMRPAIWPRRVVPSILLPMNWRALMSSRLPRSKTDRARPGAGAFPQPSLAKILRVLLGSRSPE